MGKHADQTYFRWLVGHLSCPVCGSAFPARFPNGQMRCSSHGIPKFCSYNCALNGPRHRCWKGGIANERDRDMMTNRYKEWRQSVFERDDYTCQDCGERGGRLNAHHVKRYADYPELRYDAENGKTLCVSCHYAY